MTLLGAFNRLDQLFAWFWNTPARLRMGKFGVNARLGRGLRIELPENLFIHDEARVGDYCRFAIVNENYQLNSPTLKTTPKVVLGAGSYLGSFCVVNCINEVVIGEKVLVADHCYIGDLFHEFEDTSMAIADQYLVSRGPVHIGDGTWIGNKVSVLSGVTIGKHCVIGANSVVTHDIPDYHVAVGSPARVIRRIGAGNN